MRNHFSRDFFRRRVVLHGERAFSLVELIVVVAIIAILSTIANTSFTRFKALSTQAQAKATIKNIHKSLHARYAVTEIPMLNAAGQSYAPAPNDCLSIYVIEYADVSIDCSKSKYRYQMASGGPQGFMVMATTKPNEKVCPCEGSADMAINDGWAIHDQSPAPFSDLCGVFGMPCGPIYDCVNRCLDN